MRTLTKLILILFAINANAQHFKTLSNKDFVSISLQMDLFGSLDKKGFNGVAAFQGVDFEFLEYEIQSQFIVNRDGIDYIDLQLGVGYMSLISQRVAITTGIHWGLLHRPLSKISSITYGVTLKGRLWVSNSIALIVSSSYDRRADIQDKWGVLNGRAGLEFIIN